MSRPRKPPESDIRQALIAAKRGDVNAFQLISGLSYYHRDIIKRTLPIISPHLKIKPSQVPQNPFGKPRDEDVLAMTALQTLHAGFKVWKEYEDIQQMLNTIFYDEWRNVVRWMNHLFAVFGQDNITAQHDTDVPEDIFNARAECFNCIVGCTSHLFMAMQNRPAILSTLGDNDQVGSLIAQVIIVAGRNTNSDLLLAAVWINTRIPSGGKAESDYKRYTQRHSAAYVQSVNRALGFYLTDPVKHSFELSSVIPLLANCIIHGHGSMLDAFLSQKETIPLLTLALDRCTNTLGHRSPLRTPERDTELQEQVTKVVSIAAILAASFRRGGPDVISRSLSQGLLDVFMTLRTATDLPRIRNNVIGKSVYEILDEAACETIASIRVFVIYPSIFSRVLKLLSRENRTEKILHTPPSKFFPGLNSSLRFLMGKIDTEVTVLHNYGVQDAVPNYESYFKFCDNAVCPFAGQETKLGRCTGCRTGLYCSRRCQAVVWKVGHRFECKQIAKIRRARTGFPAELSIHDQEYFRRTFLSRFLEWRARALKSGEPRAAQPITRDSVIIMDFTAFPAIVDVRKVQELSDVSSAPSIRALMPAWDKLSQDGRFSMSAEFPLELCDGETQSIAGID